jgi:hypothetical protein
MIRFSIAIVSIDLDINFYEVHITVRQPQNIFCSIIMVTSQVIFSTFQTH